jgi:hypothetical protein
LNGIAPKLGQPGLDLGINEVGVNFLVELVKKWLPACSWARRLPRSDRRGELSATDTHNV